MESIDNKVIAVKSYLLALQDSICQAFTHEDGKAEFQEDLWTYPQGGGGRTRIIADGQLFEKGAVNFSHIFGKKLPPAATQRNPQLTDGQFQALGISVVMHPLNPYVPTVHMNLRFIIADKIGIDPVWWFGGGFDLTPVYAFNEDCQHWHRTAKQACEPFGPTIYPQFKKACDEYFYLAHRQEPRGIGGIFFDDLNQWPFEQCLAFIRSIGNHFLPAYLPIAGQRKNHHYNQQQRDFQTFRRGRYVEFNLLYDRGTLFGLQAGGRTESILVSMPPQVSWRYAWQPQVNSEEARLYQEFLIAKDWV